MKTRRLTQSAAIAALYVALTLIFEPISFGAIQIRIAEMLAVLPMFTPSAVPGLFIGCLLANLLGGAIVWDVVFGSLATLIGAALGYVLRANRWLVPIPAVVSNTVIVPLVLRYGYGIEMPLGLLALYIALGEIVGCYGLGELFGTVLMKNRRIFGDDETAPGTLNEGGNGMGILSKIQGFHEAGERANENNVAQYGEPERSLYTTSKLVSIHRHMDVTDDRGQIVYQAESKVFSLHDKTDVTTADGQPVAHIERKLFSIHERHFISMADGLQFQLSNELFHLVKDITNVEGLGWRLQGNILGLNFTLFDGQGMPVAVIGQKMLSIHDKYCMDIYQPEHEKIVVAIVVTLQHMIRDREARRASSSSSSNS